MKRTLVLLSCIVVLAVGAGAQQQINFADMPLIATPAPIPAGYGGLNWSNIWYVDPNQYVEAGPGYRNFLTHRDVAFVGGQFCGPVRPACYGVITSAGKPFIPAGAIVAGGYQAHRITVLAYNNGTYLGMVTYDLATTHQMIKFPAWGAVTELQFQTDQAGDLVLIDLIVYPTT